MCVCVSRRTVEVENSTYPAISFFIVDIVFELL